MLGAISMPTATPITAVAIAVYQPRSGQADALMHRLRAHEMALCQQGCVHNPPIARLHWDDDTIVEIIEWTDDASRVRATVSPEIQAAWRAIEQVSHVARRIEVG